MRHAYLLWLVALILLWTPATAQQDPLKIAITASNGADYPAVSGPGREMDEDTAIRIAIELTNSSSASVEVSKIAGTFFNGEGQEVDQDQADPLTLRGGESQTAYLYFANPASLYEYKLTGVIEYSQSGQQFSHPIVVDTTEPVKTGY